MKTSVRHHLRRTNRGITGVVRHTRGVHVRDKSEIDALRKNKNTTYWDEGITIDSSDMRKYNELKAKGYTVLWSGEGKIHFSKQTGKKLVPRLQVAYEYTDRWGRDVFHDIHNKNRRYADVEGVLHTMTKEGEPLIPIRNTNSISKNKYGKTYSKLNKSQKEDVNHTSADSKYERCVQDVKKETIYPRSKRYLAKNNFYKRGTKEYKEYANMQLGK